MSYHVDTATLLFDDLTEDEAKLLVLKGVTCAYSPAFRAWSKALGYDERQTLPSE